MATLKNIGNYYSATPDRPYHLSVSAIILDTDNNVVCLHYPQIDELKDVFTLVSKIVRPGETLEDALKRGARNELGAEIKIITFIGTHKTADTWWGELETPTKMEKSTLFFLAKAITITPELAKEENDKEHRDVTSKTFNFLIDSMRLLAVKDGMRDFDQSDMVVRAKEWIDTHPSLTSETL